MSGFRDHFLDKYFAYRRRYVDYVAVEAPHRTRMAVLSEVVRLAFSAFGSLLCAAIFAPLVVAAAVRGGGAYVQMVVFAAFAVIAFLFGVMSLRALARAWADPRRLAVDGRRR